MKRNLSYFLLFLISLIGFQSCGEDKNYPFNQLPKQVRGIYKGTLNVSVNDADATEIVQKINVIAAGEERISLEMRNFSLGDIRLGDLKLNSAIVSKNGESYAFAATNAEIFVADMGTLLLNVSGTVEGDRLSATMMMTRSGSTASESIKCIFSGNKIEGDTESDKAEILSFQIANESVLDTEINGTDITVYFSDDLTDETVNTMELSAVIGISENASIESGAVDRFTLEEPRRYIIKAQDGINRVFYTVTAARKRRYTFDAEWVKGNETDETDPELLYYQPPVEGWTTSNAAFYLLKTGFNDSIPFVVKPLDQGKLLTRCAMIRTVDSRGKSFGETEEAPIPKISTGTLFTGDFEANVRYPLQSTRIGMDFHREPLSMKVTFKYTPGEIFYACGNKLESNKATVNKTKTDQYQLMAFLYEVENEEETLDLEAIYTSKSIVLKAQQVGGESAWKTATLKFTQANNNVYDSSKKYRMAIAFLSSRWDGSNCYNGAPGSTLLIESVEIISK